MANITTILVSKQAQERLKEIGKKGDTYDDIIVKLLNHFEKRGRDGQKRVS